MKLAGKTAIITDGGRGIGLGCATEMAKEGVSIALADRHFVEKDKPGKISSFPAFLPGFPTLDVSPTAPPRLDSIP